MDIQWDGAASLLRVTAFATAEPQEELVARGTLRELVGAVLEMAPAQQDDLVLRAAGPGWARDYDADAIRELAARPEYTGAHGVFDTADRAGDGDVEVARDAGTPAGGGVSGPDRSGARGRDGE